MCNFFSGIIDKKKNVYWKHEINNHHELIEIFKLSDNTDNTDNMTIARFEITFKNNIFDDLKEWKFRIDERITPTWFTPIYEEKCWDALKECLKDIVFINQHFDEIKDKRGIYLKDCIVNKLINSQVKYMRGNSQVNEMWENSQVNEMRENSQVKYMRGNSLAISKNNNLITILHSKESKIIIKPK